MTRARQMSTWAAILVSVAALSAPAIASGQGLPDGRVYEEVSPPEKGGNEAGAIGGRVRYAVARGGGEEIVYGTSAALGSGPTGVGPTYSVSRRTALGWETRGALPRGAGTQSIEDAPSGPFGNNFFPSPGLSRFAFATPAPYVSYGGDERFATNLYLTGEDTAIEPEWVSMPAIPNPVPPFGEIPELAAAAGPPTDTGILYFTYPGTLLAGEEDRAAQIESEPSPRSWGFFEWRDGALASAGKLPDGSLDRYGAVPADTGEFLHNDTPDFFANQVSGEGSRALFVSPDPYSQHPPSDPVELYVRENGEGTALVSRDTLAGGAPAPGYTVPESRTPGDTGVTPPQPSALCVASCEEGNYAYASPDGSEIFFSSADKLADSATGEEPGGPGPWTFEFNVASQTLTYLPGVAEPIIAATPDGSEVAFVKYTGEHSAERSGALYLSSDGRVTKVATLPEPAFTESTEGQLVVAPASLTSDGAVLVFETNSPTPDATDGAGAEPANNGGGYLQAYRYDTHTAELRCLSCPGAGVSPSGDAKLSNADQARDREHETGAGLLVGNRSMSADGRQVFFDTPEALVPGDVNGVRDVYEWEEGQVHLISTGTDPQPSFFLDNSESGADVFFATAAGLAASDTDGGYDVYDARIGGGFPRAQSTSGCQAECQGPTSGAPEFPVPASALFAGPGNLTFSAAAPRRPGSESRSQKLAKALRACRRQPPRKRHSCRARARRRYGPRRTRSATRRGAP